MIILRVLLSLLIAWVAAASAHDEEPKRWSPAVDPVAGQVKIDQRLGAAIPLDLNFRDESGRMGPLRRYFDGKPVLLALVYYNCERVCPLVLEGMARSLRPLEFRAGKDYRVIAVSIDPSEGPQLAREKKHLLMTRHAGPGNDSGWHFLTADPQSIDGLAKAVGFRYGVKEARLEKDRFVHAAAAVVVTPGGVISRYFYGFDYPPRDLRFSLIDASGNRIGSVVDQLLLLCYAYDPSQGKYTLSILNLLRLSGGATVLALGGFLVLMLRRERSGGVNRKTRR